MRWLTALPKMENRVIGRSVLVVAVTVAGDLGAQTPAAVMNNAVSRTLGSAALASHDCARPDFVSCEHGVEVVTRPTIRVLYEGTISAELEISCTLVAVIASTEADMLLIDAETGTHLVDTVTMARSAAPESAWLAPSWPIASSERPYVGVPVRTSVSAARRFFSLAPADLAHLDSLATRIGS